MEYEKIHDIFDIAVNVKDGDIDAILNARAGIVKITKVVLRRKGTVYFVEFKDGKKAMVRFEKHFGKRIPMFYAYECPFMVEDMEHYYGHYYYCHLIDGGCKHPNPENFEQCKRYVKQVVYRREYMLDV
ncbi:MAG: hypothetical protein ACTSXW_08485 [Candidatus Baldrarchaeia archaeon]